MTASSITRRKSRQVMVGDVPIGGDAPIAVQSMTNTETCDVAATVAQITALQSLVFVIKFINKIYNNEINKSDLIAKSTLLEKIVS